MARMERVQVAELVRKAQAGDSEAMNQLLKTAYKNILFQCQRIMNHPQDAEDMAQEVLLQIYESLGTLREPERFISWANTIASRRCIRLNSWQAVSWPSPVVAKSRKITWPLCSPPKL